MKECEAFNMSDSKKAFEHIIKNFEVIKKYNDKDYQHPLYVWDDGYRVLGKCKKCASYILLQSSEYHAFDDSGDSYYRDYFSVKSEDEAEQLNQKYNGWQLESEFNRKWLAVTNGDACWKDNRTKFMIDIRDRDEREKFINEVLSFDGMILVNDGFNDFDAAKEDLINSIFPIIFDFENMELSHVKNTTCAAAAITNKSNFITAEEVLEKVKNKIGSRKN